MARAEGDAGRRPPDAGPRTIHLVALGCPKNRVDSERMAGLARDLGLTLVAEAAEADVLLVNTCGFVREAVEESLGVVLELAGLKEERPGRLLIVAGCLSQRHPEELARELPEVDHFVGSCDLPGLQRILEARGGDAVRVAPGPPPILDEDRWERLLPDRPHAAFLKIAEGCDRPCAFCIIPALRGPQRSRTVGSLVREAEGLLAAGVRELTLVAQDTTAYGRDLDPRVTLAELLAALDPLPGLRWLRVLYAYPSAVDRRLARAMAELPRVVPYLDLPIQHIDDDVLRLMKRGYDGRRVRRTLDLLRSQIPGVTLRSTLISGHPGETPAAHRRLLAFVEEAELDHLGVFPFSPEEGTRAAGLPLRVSAPLARRRAGELMELQREVSRRKLRRLRGRLLEVLVEGPSEESEFLMQGRHAGQAPEVDGVVQLADCGALAGAFVMARVEDSGDYDLVARTESRD